MPATQTPFGSYGQLSTSREEMTNERQPPRFILHDFFRQDKSKS